jgi:hypothetical protein
MGTLKPGATYIYEYVDNVVYAREQGADPSTRFEIGYEYDPVSGHKIDYDKRASDRCPLFEKMKEDKMWGEIRRASKDNPALQNALEQCILLYKLTEHYEQRYGNSKT